MTGQGKRSSGHPSTPTPKRSPQSPMDLVESAARVPASNLYSNSQHRAKATECTECIGHNRKFQFQFQFQFLLGMALMYEMIMGHDVIARPCKRHAVGAEYYGELILTLFLSTQHIHHGGSDLRKKMLTCVLRSWVATKWTGL